MVSVCNLNTWEAEAEGWQLPGQPVLHSEILSQKQTKNKMITTKQLARYIKQKNELNEIKQNDHILKTDLKKEPIKKFQLLSKNFIILFFILLEKRGVLKPMDACVHKPG
jgi:hypothetical protein